MKLGLQIISFDWPGSPQNTGARLAEIAMAAEAAGFSNLWVMDHFFQMDVPSIGFKPPDPMLDGYTALSFLAHATQRIRLGTMVTSVVNRHPGHLLKIISALDVLSGGRAVLGIGAGWYEREAQGLGIPFPPLKERFERLEETLQIFTQAWSGDFSAYNGKHYQLAAPVNSPQPLAKPHPPILVGGEGEKKTLRLVAKYADACNLSLREPDEIRRKLNILKGYCAEFGRPYEKIEKTSLDRLNFGDGGLSSTALIAKCKVLADAGIQQFLFSLENNSDIALIEKIGREVIPAIQDF